ncbi:hypothetical protein [Phocoenobacter skyensis]|uniref:Uncharacterized protein n=1 Tax=Phocoenobacter skyensis TaxID=97481 RepID=A0A1H7ZFG5_9PAST|nr:hypothetical protein [Pasteurella skyensis]MDP8079883.1 hypothetical protein [Pasteurella skyensis]MDP8085795.1 hypothetical protein [Pasteurella skyensis]MDP8185982.1 hypothetical protein [Pasteurella skyensis]QLB21881.1 hypothetical protein A6B44_01105 [Pasteurella skyensis]SEM57130.1 hypothetical protein SAMN05444853_12511 [Pasteurella skyensis]
MKNNNSLLQSFLTIYFHKIENLLNKNSSGLKEVKFQSSEANTDEHLKLFFQKFLIENNSILDTEIKELVIKIDNLEETISVDNLYNYKIVKVLLPEDLTDDQKLDISESKKSVYTNPDLYLKISDGTNIFYESVELKSTKNNKIQGSSIQQVLPFEWVIFIKRSNKKIQITTGFYINSITDKLPFPDRSPRPQIGFDTLLDWNNKYRFVQEDRLIVENNLSVNNEKLRLLDDWQDFLTAEWLEIVLSKNKVKNEKWFNNTLRKFALKLLEYNNTITDQEKNELIDSLSKLIE